MTGGSDIPQTVVPVGGADLAADLVVPDDANGLVAFAHGSGSSRKSPRNRQVGQTLNRRGLATLLLDLLTEAEERIDLRTRELRFDIPMLARRMTGAIDWAVEQEDLALPIGLFGASTGAAAALIAAADRPDAVRGIVSRGGRADLAGNALPRVDAPTLLIVGERDQAVLRFNREAAARMTASTSIVVVPGAGHLFEEPGALDTVADLAGDWFVEHL
ncbi:MAG TPA: alpha/beta family hydrolase [Acidimicrobiia bacterium]|nr:alpha/beta family hydrolase [Acidimicrobiia bacterium]